jgi:hypothetical protein
MEKTDQEFEDLLHYLNLPAAPGAPVDPCASVPEASEFAETSALSPNPRTKNPASRRRPRVPLAAQAQPTTSSAACRACAAPVTWLPGPVGASAGDGLPNQLGHVNDQIGSGLAWLAGRADLAGADADHIVQSAVGLAVGLVER